MLLVNLYFSVVGEVLAFSAQGLGFLRRVSVNCSQYLTIESEWGRRVFHENAASGRPSPSLCLNLVSAFAAQIEKFTVDTKMSCLHPSSFQVAYSGRDAKFGTFP